MHIQLPYPPSANRYWRRSGRHIHISTAGRDYRYQVAELLPGGLTLAGRLAVRLRMHPPDRRKRDIDNIQKPTLDALEHAGVFIDDSQIDWLLTERMPVAKGGLVECEIVDRTKTIQGCPLCGK